MRFYHNYYFNSENFLWLPSLLLPSLSLFPYLHPDFTDLISFGDSFDGDILYREVTKNPCFFVDEMSVSMRIALIVGFPIDAWESPEESLLCHRFDIAVDGCLPDLLTLSTHLFIDIVRREVTTFASCTDDFSILVGSQEMGDRGEFLILFLWYKAKSFNLINFLLYDFWSLCITIMRIVREKSIFIMRIILI